MTTVGRLLRAITENNAIDLAVLARRLRIPERALRDCRDGVGTLEPEVQIVVAALVIEMVPQQARLARRLFGQAQSALRVREGAVISHATYHRTG